MTGPVGIYRGFAGGYQHSMRTFGAFLAYCARATFPDAPVIEEYDNPQLPTVFSSKTLYNIDRYLVPRNRFYEKALELLLISDQSDAYVSLHTKAERKLIVCHDVLPRLLELGLVEGPRPSAAGRWLIAQNGKAMSRADRIVCVSNSTREDLIRYYDVDPDRVEVIYNSDLLDMEARTEYVPQRDFNFPAQIKGARYTILSLGGGKFQKNIRAVPNVLKILVDQYGLDIRWIILGVRDFPEGPLDERISFLTNISSGAVRALYNHVSAVYIPSLHEGFGLPVIEAQRHDVPVVCSDRGALPEVVGKGGEVVGPHDYNAAARALASLVIDGPERGALIEAGRTNLRRFDQDLIVGHYSRVLRHTISDDASRRRSPVEGD